ncbi:MAG: hypothetical protein Q4C41_09405 [Eggerthellaceae bacterium]|nr:hypothetical protein [Eggerthellaceae bacterium]
MKQELQEKLQKPFKGTVRVFGRAVPKKGLAAAGSALCAVAAVAVAVVLVDPFSAALGSGDADWSAASADAAARAIAAQDASDAQVASDSDAEADGSAETDDAAHQGEGQGDDQGKSADAAADYSASDGDGQAGAQSGGGFASGSTSSAESGAAPAHTHTWVEQIEVIEHPAQYQIIHHDAVGSYMCICNGCGAQFATDDEMGAHAKAQLLAGNYACGSYRVEFVATQQAYDEQVLVQDAWTETVTTGSYCAVCGATK